MPTFYQIDSARANVQEKWWGCRGKPITFALALLLKCLRVRYPMASDDANVDSTLPFVVESLPDEIAARFAPLAAELQALGFTDPIYHAIVHPDVPIRIYWATFRHASGQHAARIHNRYWDTQAKCERAFFPIFFTAFADHTFAFSSNGQPDIAAPPQVHMNRLPGVTTAALWTSHQQLVAQLAQTKSIRTIADTSDLLHQSERLHLTQRDFHLHRKFFREPTAQETSSASNFSARLDAARAQGVQHPEVIAEIARLEDPKPRFANALWLLIFSLVAFVAIGAAQWQWETTLWLIPILFFHEFGHWVAMKMFGYRSMRMFFIPFFGAAVAGQNRTSPGWQKAVVSLAGPLPGIILGAFLCVLAISTGIPWLRRCALLLILVNVFNLVPLLPLDGGRFLQVTLFCRHRWLDLLFRLAAIVGLFLLSLKGFGGSLFALPIFLALSLPAALLMGRITDHFRRHPLPPPLPGEEHIPLATADALATAVRQVLRKSSNRVVAQNVLNIYETLNARPPSVLATLGLLAAYFGGIILSAVLIFSLVVTKHGSFSDFMAAVHSAPRQTVTPETIWVKHGISPSPAEHFVVTTLKDAPTARRQFFESAEALSLDTPALLFGSSIIVGFPANTAAQASSCLADLTVHSTNTFITSTNLLNLTLSFIAPNESVATNLEQDLTGYFRLDGHQLIPPWDPITESPDFAVKWQARKILERMDDQYLHSVADAMTAVWAKALASSNKNHLNATNYGADIHQTLLSIGDKDFARFTAEYSGTPYLAVVELDQQLAHLDETNHAERNAILAQLAEKIGRYDSTNAPDAATDGDISRNGLTVTISALKISTPETNLPQIIHWLAAQGCHPIRYRLNPE